MLCYCFTFRGKQNDLICQYGWLILIRQFCYIRYDTSHKQFLKINLIKIVFYIFNSYIFDWAAMEQIRKGQPTNSVCETYIVKYVTYDKHLLLGEYLYLKKCLYFSVLFVALQIYVKKYMVSIKLIVATMISFRKEIAIKYFVELVAKRSSVLLKRIRTLLNMPRKNQKSVFICVFSFSCLDYIQQNTFFSCCLFFLPMLGIPTQQFLFCYNP